MYALLIMGRRVNIDTVMRGTGRLYVWFWIAVFGLVVLAAVAAIISAVT